ncbi:hypothetical protein NDU88_001989 [Pleurodeles waltl]|uniref:Uncharacterized protein n=1 Tax=Pleurodeles waltl TaxID=8319 RepID=A0AAV7TKD2_PLEWA|nr:hypothetical protein NDU88_001989 [Pleurodeles waltl]
MEDRVFDFECREHSGIFEAARASVVRECSAAAVGYRLCDLEVGWQRGTEASRVTPKCGSPAVEVQAHVACLRCLATRAAGCNEAALKS